jgi:hypothetical protein
MVLQNVVFKIKMMLYSVWYVLHTTCTVLVVNVLVVKIIQYSKCVLRLVRIES